MLLCEPLPAGMAAIAVCTACVCLPLLVVVSWQVQHPGLVGPAALVPLAEVPTLTVGSEL